MEIAALASGSSGNCFYVGDSNDAILIDVGISAKQVVTRLLSIGGNPENIRAIFITHEHIDHIRGCDVLARKLGIPIYATQATIDKGFLCDDADLIKVINNDGKIDIGKLKVQAFSKSHSAGDPVSYSIYSNKKVSVITDAGYACENIKSHISDCNFLFIEANHDEDMLQNGPYPFFLKKWISGKGGHLSNKEAATSIAEHSSEKLQKVVLSHLSKKNNTPDVALKTFQEILGSKIGAEVIVSHREVPTEMFRI